MWAVSQQLKQRSNMHQRWFKCNVVVNRKGFLYVEMCECGNIDCEHFLISVKLEENCPNKSK